MDISVAVNYVYLHGQYSPGADVLHSIHTV